MGLNAFVDCTDYCSLGDRSHCCSGKQPVSGKHSASSVSDPGSGLFHR